MTTPLLTTKLYIPPVRPRERVVPRPRLIERLNDGLHRKLILISAPAGFGKTALISHWVQQMNLPVAWLSLDEGDNDPIWHILATDFHHFLASTLNNEPRRGNSRRFPRSFS
jgi:LuxR family maltose regulon positive regulatory protein